MRLSRHGRKKPLQDSCNTFATSPHSFSEARSPGGRQLSRPAPNLARDDDGNAPAGERRSGYLAREVLARGIRLTQQRRIVLGVIEATPQCRNVSVLHRRARKVDSLIHRVTVYRTLVLLKRHGLIGESDCVRLCVQQDSCPRFLDLGRVQMTCLRCGKMVEFESGVFGEVSRCIEKDCRFRIASARLELGGYCQECRT